MRKFPKVAITGASIVYNNDEKSPLRVVRDKYFKLIEMGGGLPALISNSLDKKVLDEYSNFFDSLLLTGGGDVNPKYYKKSKDKMTGAYDMVIDDVRDESEIYLVKKFYGKGKPILGICRGSQVINVALGGTLTQDIKENQNGKVFRHLIPDEEGGWYIAAHPVSFEKETFLGKLSAFPNKYLVNSVHHQCIDKIGKDLKVAAKSSDGIVEAVEHKDIKRRFVLGVQWHIEQMPDDKLAKSIVKEFIRSSLK